MRLELCLPDGKENLLVMTAIKVGRLVGQKLVWTLMNRYISLIMKFWDQVKNYKLYQS